CTGAKLVLHKHSAVHLLRRTFGCTPCSTHRLSIRRSHTLLHTHFLSYSTGPDSDRAQQSMSFYPKPNPSCAPCARRIMASSRHTAPRPTRGRQRLVPVGRDEHDVLDAHAGDVAAATATAVAAAADAGLVAREHRVVHVRRVAHRREQM